MRHFFVTLFLLIGGAVFGQQEWHMRNPYPVGDTLTSITFIDSLHAIAVGAKGAIVHTENSGVSWSIIASGTKKQLTGVVFRDQLNGLIVGSGSALLRTSDGGMSWNLDSLPFPINAAGIAMKEDVCLIVGEKGKILRSVDAGIHWDTIATGYGHSLASVGIYGPQFAYCCGTGGFIMRSNDLGLTWIKDTTITTSNLHAIQFISNSIGYAAGEGGINLKTTDGGLHWKSSEKINIAFPINALYFVTDSIGYAACGTGIYYTTDGATHWAKSASSSATILGAAVFNKKSLIFVGVNGVITRSLLDSIAWSTNIFTSAILHGVAFRDSINAVAVGQRTILQTSDAGKTWKIVDSLSDETIGTYHTIYFIDPLNGICVGETGVVLRTSDGGTTWKRISTQSKDHLLHVAFADSLIGVAVGIGPTIRTTDGGNTWSELSTVLPLQKSGISFATNLIGFLVGQDGGMIKTTDAGLTWKQVKPVSKAFFYDIQFVTSTVGFIVGDSGTILKTTDQGETWKRQSSPLPGLLLSSSFLNPSVGTIAGAGGAIMMTSDGGEHWAVHNVLTTKRLLSVAVSPTGNAIIVGESGVILNATLSPGETSVSESKNRKNSNHLIRQSFPNPCDALFTLTIEPSSTSTTIELLNEIGQIVHSTLIPLSGENSATFDMSLLPEGVYYCRVNNGKATEVRNIVVEH